MPIQQISTEYVAIDPDYCFGKPRIVGTRITVAAIAEMYLEMGQSLEEIAIKYDLSLAAVYAAMAYYYDHREEIERHNLETERIVEEMKLTSASSKFQEKQKTLSLGEIVEGLVLIYEVYSSEEMFGRVEYL